MCCDILKATVAGAGVGVSNVEVRFKDVEIARMHFSDRVNRIHQAPGTLVRMKPRDQMLPLAMLWSMEGH